jgi:metal-sulfur cluster biosynthetic enzyme/nitrite reductase/ring-hydroxylating ferredoxin subunit
MERLIGTDELQSGEQQSVFVDDIPALVVRVDDNYYVIEDVCSHDGQPLTNGTVQDGAITCPRHGAKFDLKTGAALCMPATKGIRTFRVEIKDGAVWASEDTPSLTPVNVPVASVAKVSVPGAGTAASPTDQADTPATKDDSAPSSASDYLEALRQVIDPELMINIVDLGLIYSVEQDEENERKVTVDMTLTSPACPAGPQLVQQSKMALERLHDIDEAAITLVMSPPWTPERMTDDARDQLGIF